MTWDFVLIVVLAVGAVTACAVLLWTVYHAGKLRGEIEQMRKTKKL